MARARLADFQIRVDENDDDPRGMQYRVILMNSTRTYVYNPDTDWAPSLVDAFRYAGEDAEGVINAARERRRRAAAMED